MNYVRLEISSPVFTVSMSKLPSLLCRNTNCYEKWQKEGGKHIPVTILLRSSSVDRNHFENQNLLKIHEFHDLYAVDSSMRNTYWNACATKIYKIGG